MANQLKTVTGIPNNYLLTAFTLSNLVLLLIIIDLSQDLITALPNVGIGTRPVDKATNNMIRIDERLDDLIENTNLTTATTDSTREFKRGIQMFNYLAGHTCQASVSALTQLKLSWNADYELTSRGSVTQLKHNK
ncbi:hypothetical protein BY996DRAFT_6469127 [Phakopsora pachyrhizi]|nr:hypothetical protein BY996DRAFT_6469127 [Phakopsora pachyrhizi]